MSNASALITRTQNVVLVQQKLNYNIAMLKLPKGLSNLQYTKKHYRYQSISL